MRSFSTRSCPQIVQRLLSGETCIAESHQCVTILFSDIVGWTNIAEAIPTSAVIKLLNDMFSAFDALLDKYGVCKVETIGDAYMVAAGHDGCADHAARVMLMGLGMLEATRQVKPPPNMRLQIRVGIHSGPAFTGVVGHKVPRYCFFGDTVNVSSRMESNGVPGVVHISKAARDCIGDADLNGASMTRRGTIEIKGKGPMETHFVVPSGTAIPPPDVEKVSPPIAKAPTPAEQFAEANATKALLSQVDALKAELSLERQLRAGAEAAPAAVLETPVLVPRRPDADAGRLCASSNTSTKGTSRAADSDIVALRLELAVKKKSLADSRRYLHDKDDQLDAKELELQHALMALNDAGLVTGGTSRLLLLNSSVHSLDSAEDGQLRQRRGNGFSGIGASD